MLHDKEFWNNYAEVFSRDADIDNADKITDMINGSGHDITEDMSRSTASMKKHVVQHIHEGNNQVIIVIGGVTGLVSLISIIVTLILIYKRNKREKEERKREAKGCSSFENNHDKSHNNNLHTSSSGMDTSGIKKSENNLIPFIVENAYTVSSKSENNETDGAELLHMTIAHSKSNFETKRRKSTQLPIDSNRRKTWNADEIRLNAEHHVFDSVMSKFLRSIPYERYDDTTSYGSPHSTRSEDDARASSG